MQADPTNALMRELESLGDWWREAGVDIAVGDDEQDWLAATAQFPRNEVAQGTTEQVRKRDQLSTIRQDSPANPAAFDPSEFTSLAGLAHAFSADSRLEPFGGVGERITLSPVESPTLMVLVDMPSPTSHEEILAGPERQIWLDLLKSCKLDVDQVYLAPILPRHVPAGDVRSPEFASFANLAAHHICLAAPKLLAIAGGAGASALEGNISTKMAGNLHDFNHEGLSIPCTAVPSFAVQANRPELKRRSWARFLELLGRGNW